MLFSFEPIQEMYDAARAVIQSSEQGRAVDITALQVAMGKLERVAADRMMCAEHVATAQKETYEDVQVDSHPLVAVTEDGAWVNVWVFVPDKE